jgi:uncharacterized protein (TIGR03066 family)
MRMILAGLLATLVLGPTLSADDKKDEKIDAAKLVGKWEPKEKKEGTSVTIEFTKDGKIMISGTRGGQDFKADGTYKIDGNQMTQTLTLGDKEQTATRTIKKLTDTEVVMTDEKGMERTLLRIKDK